MEGDKVHDRGHLAGFGKKKKVQKVKLNDKKKSKTVRGRKKKKNYKREAIMSSESGVSGVIGVYYCRECYKTLVSKKEKCSGGCKSKPMFMGAPVMGEKVIPSISVVYSYFPTDARLK